MGCTGFSSCSVWAQYLWHVDSSSCGTQALERMGFSSCGVWAQQLWRAGLVALQHMGSSRTRDRTRVPCTGRWILNHCATREVLKSFIKIPRINQSKFKTVNSYSIGCLSSEAGKENVPFCSWIIYIKKKKSSCTLTLHKTSTGVDIFFSLIFSYFCFFVAACGK